MQIGTKMSTKKIESKSEFEKFIKEEITKLKALMESETVSKTIDPLKVDMKQGDKVSKSEESALVYKDPSGKKTKKGTESSEDASSVKMNQNDKDGGSDEKAATAVEVKASGKSEKGQAKANFTSKTDSPSKDSSTPFKEKSDKKMNSNDGNIDDNVPKTYIETGEKKGGSDVTSGQHKANVKEKAPDSKDEKPITDWIQLKEKYTQKELFNFILNEAKKLAKRDIIKEELSKIKSNINKL